MACSSAPRRPRPGARTNSGVVSIGETPGAPGGPGFSGYYAPAWGIYRPMTFGIDSHRPLTTNEKGALLAGLTLVLPHVALATRTYAAGLSAMRLGFKFGVPYAFGSGFDWNRSIQPDLDFLGPGGGGPGLSPISTNPPPSVEATGASFAQHGKTEGPARVSKRGSRPRRKCKPGYRWNGHRCVRKD